MPRAEIFLLMQLLLVVLNPGFHEQAAHFVLGLRHLPHQQIAVT